ncbi:MAG: C40 family peptidase [Armatimonadetes bacterium]|nr:C40 family peptidase [Armatimonadota bacterium]
MTSSRDNDWLIAHRYGISVRALHEANPNVNFKALRAHKTLIIPGASAKVASGHETHGKSANHGKVAVHKASKAGTYTASASDNDWTIARRFGTSAKAIRLMNPDIDFRRLRPGKKISVPGESVASNSTPRHFTSRYAVLKGDNVNVRREPSTDSRRITRVDAGRVVTVLDRDGDWYRVRFDGGTKGWVRYDFLRAAKAPRHHRSSEEHVAYHHHSKHSYDVESRHHGRVAEGKLHSGSRSSLIATAESFRGERYRYGAASRSGTDCSGLTTQVFRSHGVSLPRTAHEQAEVGKRVSKDELKPGDLVFFHTRGGRSISHVGIYKGNGVFIHASSGKRKVTESSLDEGYYARHFAGARRVLKDKAKKKSPDSGE